MLQFFKLIQVQNIFYSKKAKKKISRKTKKTKVTDSSGSESESEEEEAMWLEKTGRERERERERERFREREIFNHISVRVSAGKAESIKYFFSRMCSVICYYKCKWHLLFNLHQHLIFICYVYT